MEHTITIPRLYCPFPSRISPFAEKVDQHTFRWLHKYDLLQSQEMYAKFKKFKFAWMTARTYPYADYEFLCIANNLYSWLFVLDDQLDNIKPETNSVREKTFLQKFIADFTRILRYDKMVSPDEGGNILASLSDFWGHMLKISSASWQSQFALSFKATFEAAVWEAVNAKKNRLPDVEQYMGLRPFFSGANLGTDMIEVATKVSLPIYILQNEKFQKLVDLARRVVCWANDLFSLSKELAHGDEHNLVIVLMNERGIPLEEAISEAAKVHNREVRQFIELKYKLPSFGDKKIDDDIRRYLDALEVMVRGFFDWSIYDTERYHFVYNESQRRKAIITAA